MSERPTSSGLPAGGEANADKPSRFDLTEENVAKALDVARRSTPDLRWGPAPYEPGDMEKLMAKSGGGTVWCAWAGPKEDEVYAALTGNGPTSEVNAVFYAHARDLVIALIEERAAYREALMSIARSSDLDGEARRVARRALEWPFDGEPERLRHG